MWTGIRGFSRTSAYLLCLLSSVLLPSVEHGERPPIYLAHRRPHSTILRPISCRARRCMPTMTVTASTLRYTHLSCIPMVHRILLSWSLKEQLVKDSTIRTHLAIRTNMNTRPNTFTTRLNSPLTLLPSIYAQIPTTTLLLRPITAAAAVTPLPLAHSVSLHTISQISIPRASQHVAEQGLHWSSCRSRSRPASTPRHTLSHRTNTNPSTSKVTCRMFTCTRETSR